MGRRAKFLRAVKKVFAHESKKSRKSKEKPGIGKARQSDTSASVSIETAAPVADLQPATTAIPLREEVKPVEPDHGQGDEVNMAAAAAAVVPSKILSYAAGKSREEVAAIKIQTAFRGHLARRALRALRGLVRLKSLIHGNSVKRQATTTLRCMQTLARVQSQIRSRRIRMSEENQALQRQLLLKRERELETLRMGEEWDDSLQSKEQIETSLLSKQEAAIKRERALAYAFSHQWKNSSKSANPLFMDPNNPHWGWSWLERWMAARPWEGRSTSDKTLNDDRASVKSTSISIGGEITNSYARRDTSSDKLSPATQKSGRPAGRHSPSTPKSKAPFAAGKLVKSASPRRSWVTPEDDSRSMISMQSERQRRHSLAGSSVRDDESIASLASSPAVPSFMAPTESARAKSRFQTASIDKIEGSPDRASVASVKKRLSFPVGEKHSATPLAGVRRHSGPPKVGVASAKGGAMAVHPEHHLNNGGRN